MDVNIFHVWKWMKIKIKITELFDVQPFFFSFKCSKTSILNIYIVLSRDVLEIIFTCQVSCLRIKNFNLTPTHAW